MEMIIAIIGITATLCVFASLYNKISSMDGKGE